MTTTTTAAYLDAFRDLVAAAQYGGQAALVRCVVGLRLDISPLLSTSALPGGLVWLLPSDGVHPHTTAVGTYRIGLAVFTASHYADAGEAAQADLLARMEAIAAHLRANGPGTGAIALRMENEPAQAVEPPEGQDLIGIMRTWTATLRHS